MGGFGEILWGKRRLDRIYGQGNGVFLLIVLKRDKLLKLTVVYFD